MSRSTLRKAGDESGFTLVELLIAILIVGLLATIGLSTLLSKRSAASDASAKQLMSTAQQAATEYSLTNGYAGMTPAGLKLTQPAINITANGQAILVNAAPTLTGYLLTTVSSNGDTFNLTYANGVGTRTCTVATGNGNTSTNTGGGCKNGAW
jgi:prepilin-type N-terminal cleavage/methylation domain-containing protein